MSADKNVQIMRRWFQEVWNEGRTETIHDLFSPHAVAHGQESAEGELHGPHEFEAFVRRVAHPTRRLLLCEFTTPAGIRGREFGDRRD